MYLKKVKLINHDSLPILMLFIVLAYLMLFAALTNAVCLNNASSFFVIDLIIIIMVIFKCYFSGELIALS